MLNVDRSPVDVDSTGVRALCLEDLPAARQLLATTYGLDAGTAAAALSDHSAKEPGPRIWGLFAGDQLVACATFIRDEGGIVVVWSMATLPKFQGLGYGRRLFITAQNWHLEHGSTATLLQGTEAGQKLYRDIGFKSIEHWQLWSRPRWMLGA
jgi:GNAT superfamily N-acetyltransferase